MSWNLEPVPASMQRPSGHDDPPYQALVRWRGLELLIENKVGTKRKHADGSTTMRHHYGEVRGSMGTDGDPVDVFLGPDPDAPKVYVVHQKHPGTAVHDEDKAMLGWATQAEAVRAYRDHYDRGGFYDGCTAWPVEEWVQGVHQKQHRGQKLDKPIRVRKLLDMAKGVVRGHVRKTKSGKLAQVKQHTRKDGPHRTLTIDGREGRYRIADDGRTVESWREWTDRNGEHQAQWIEVRNYDIATQVREAFDPEKKREGEARRARMADPAPEPEPEPDDYRMSHQPSKAAPAHDLEGGESQTKDVLSHPEWFTAFPEQLREFWPKLKAAQGKPDATITVYRALPKEHRSLQTGNWVTLSKRYAEDHAEGEDGWHVIAVPVPLRDLYWAGDDLAEWGYWGDGAEAMEKAVQVRAHTATRGGKRVVVKQHTRKGNPRHAWVKQGAKFDTPHGPHTVEAIQGDTATIRPDGGGRSYSMPVASVGYHAEDMNQKLGSRPNSGNATVNAVLQGKGKRLGKGNDGIAYKVGDKVAKASTTTPFVHDNPGHRTPEGAVAHLRNEHEAHQALASNPLVQPTEWEEHDGRGWLVKPYLHEIRGKLTRAELAEVEKGIDAIHAKGWVVGDEIQLGRNDAGELKLMDLGQARHVGTDGAGRWDSPQADDQERLDRLFASHGVADRLPSGEVLRAREAKLRETIGRHLDKGTDASRRFASQWVGEWRRLHKKRGDEVFDTAGDDMLDRVSAHMADGEALEQKIRQAYPMEKAVQVRAHVAQRGGKRVMVKQHVRDVEPRVNANPHKGQRTLGVSEEQLHGIALSMLHTLEAHGRSVEGSPTMVRSPEAGFQTIDLAPLRLTAADGRPVHVRMALMTHDAAPGKVMSGGVGTIRSTGEKVVIVNLPGNLAMEREDWARKVRAVLAHELTHVIDPATWLGGLQSSKMADDGRMADYHNTPGEVAAYRHEAFRELNQPRVAEGARRMAHVYERTGKRSDQVMDALLTYSPTWRKVKDDLTPANRRKFIEMAAQLMEAHIDGTSEPMEMGDQQSLFGDQRVVVKAHVRKTKQGLTRVKEHQASRRKARPDGLDELARSLGATVSVEAGPDSFRAEFRRDGKAIGFFRASEVSRRSFEWDRVPDEVRDAVGSDALWAVRSAEWYDASIRGKGAGAVAYKAMIDHARNHGAAVAHDEVSGGSTSDSARAVWRRVAEQYPTKGDVILPRRRGKAKVGRDEPADRDLYSNPDAPWKVAVLYVDPRGPYQGMAAEVYDEKRDARTYTGDLPVVAHPPCGPWGRLAWRSQEEKDTAIHAVEQVRRCGGVLEHPVGSQLFKTMGIPVGDWDNPERETDAWGGYTIKIKQIDMGHRAEKETILYIVGTQELPLALALRNVSEGDPVPVQSMGKVERRLTPEALAWALCSLAQHAKPPGSPDPERMEKSVQLSLFGGGQQQVQVKQHVRQSKSGKLSMVKEHQATRAKAAEKQPTMSPVEQWVADGQKLLDAAEQRWLAKWKDTGLKMALARMDKRGLAFHDDEAGKALLIEAVQADARQDIWHGVKNALLNSDVPRAPSTLAENCIEAVIHQRARDKFFANEKELEKPPFEETWGKGETPRGRAWNEQFRRLLAVEDEFEAEAWAEGEKIALSGGLDALLEWAQSEVTEAETREKLKREHEKIQPGWGVTEDGLNMARAMVPGFVIAARREVEAEAELRKMNKRWTEATYWPDGEPVKGDGKPGDADDNKFIQRFARASAIGEGSDEWRLSIEDQYAGKGEQGYRDIGYHVGDALVTPFPGEAGAHWGSVVDPETGEINNHTAIGLSVVVDGGTLRNPSKGMQEEHVAEKLKPLDRWRAQGRHLFAQREMAKYPIKDHDRLWRGMQIPLTAVESIADTFERTGSAALPLLGCTAFTFDWKVATQYLDSQWTEAASKALTPNEMRARVMVVVERSPEFDATVGMVHPDWKDRSKPPFEILTAAKRMEVVNVSRPSDANGNWRLVVRLKAEE